MKNRLNFPKKSNPKKNPKQTQLTPEQIKEAQMQARNSICLHARGLAELITPGSQFTINVKTGKIITPGQVNGSGGGRLDIITVTRPLYTETLDYQVPA